MFATLQPAWNPVSLAGLHLGAGGCHRPLFQRRKTSAQVKPFLGFEMKADAEERRKESQRRYYERNKQQVIDRAKAWKAANKEKVSAGAKVYRDSHKEEMKALQDAWAESFQKKEGKRQEGITPEIQRSAAPSRGCITLNSKRRLLIAETNTGQGQSTGPLTRTTKSKEDRG